MIPVDVAEMTRSRALVSSGAVEYWKSDQAALNGMELSREGIEIFNEQGEEAYEKWKREVYFPLMDEKMKRLKLSRFRKRGQGVGQWTDIV